MPFVCHTTMQQLFDHNHHKHFTANKEKNRKTFLNLVVNLIHCFLHWQKVGGEGGGEWGGYCRTVWQETKLEHVFSLKTGSLNCNSCPGSIQCERTSFPTSFKHSAGKKNIPHHRKEFLSLRDIQMYEERGETAVFAGYILKCYSFFEHSKRIFYGDSIKFQTQYL